MNLGTFQSGLDFSSVLSIPDRILAVSPECKLYDPSEQQNSPSHQKKSTERLSHFLKFSPRLAMLTGSSAYRGNGITYSCFNTSLCAHWLILAVTSHMLLLCMLLVYGFIGWILALRNQLDLTSGLTRHSTSPPFWNSGWSKSLCTKGWVYFHWDPYKELPDPNTKGTRWSSWSSDMLSECEFHNPPANKKYGVPRDHRS